MSSYNNYAEINEGFNKTYRFWMAHTEQYICTTTRASVYCVDKTYCPRPAMVTVTLFNQYYNIINV